MTLHMNHYRKYVEMIDLTVCDSEGDESGSEIDELPLPAIALQHVDASRLVVIIHYGICKAIIAIAMWISFHQA